MIVIFRDGIDGFFARYSSSFIGVLNKQKSDKMSLEEKIRSIWLDEPQQLFNNSAVSIGSFDGIHIGHQKLLHHLAVVASNRALYPILLTFDPHPRLVLSNDISVLTTVSEREILLRESQITCIVHIRFTPQIARLSFYEFIEQYLIHSLGVKHLIVGYDHHFGRDRSGNPNTLRQLGERLGFEVEVIPPVSADGVIVKSSTIRELISQGKIEDATKLLGHEYLVMGKSSPGRGLGRHIGYPTANLYLPPHKLLPPDGVYAVSASILPNSTRQAGMLYIGKAPTFELPKRMFEVHIFDHDGSPLYGRLIATWIHKFIRPEMSFKSVDALRKQIDRDAEMARSILQTSSLM